MRSRSGTTSEESNPTHTFRKPGLYAVTLTVTKSEGLSSQAAKDSDSRSTRIVVL